MTSTINFCRLKAQTVFYSFLLYLDQKPKMNQGRSEWATPFSTISPQKFGLIRRKIWLLTSAASKAGHQALKQIFQ